MPGGRDWQEEEEFQLSVISPVVAPLPKGDWNVLTGLGRQQGVHLNSSETVARDKHAAFPPCVSKVC